KWDGQQLTIQISAKLSGIDEDHIFYLKDLPKHWIDLYNNSPNLSVWANLKDGQLNELRDYYELSLSMPQIKCIHEVVVKMRRIKTDAEVEAIQTASQIGAKGIATVIEKARPNVYEYELEAEHDYVMKSHGLKTPQYKTILG